MAYVSNYSDPPFDVTVVPTTRRTAAVLRAAVTDGRLPDYRSGLRWCAAPADLSDWPRWTQLVVVLLEHRRDAISVGRWIPRLARRGALIFVIASPALARSLEAVNGALLVVGTSADPLENLRHLAHAVLAPALGTKLACVDWSDLRGICAGAAQAKLLVIQAASVEEAREKLTAVLPYKAADQWLGGFASLASTGRCRMADFYPVYYQIRRHVRSDRWCVMSLSIYHEAGSDIWVTIFAITAARERPRPQAAARMAA